MAVPMRPPRDGDGRRGARLDRIVARVAVNRSGGGAAGQMVVAALVLAVMIVIVRAAQPVHGAVTGTIKPMLDGISIGL